MKFYKYMNLSIGAKFIQAPLLRLSNQNCLNDPFEFKLTSNSSSKIEKIWKSANNEKNNPKEWASKFWSHGIISLTESYDNLLMWSHYSDEHRGVVIEICIDENNPFALFNDTKDIVARKDCTFHKVNYRKFRQYNEEILESSLDDVRNHYMLSKSDEWIYEKEYRYVLHHSCADVIFLNKNNELYRKIINDIKLDEGNLKHTDTYVLIPVKDNLISEENVLMLWTCSEIIGAMFFKIITPASINKIYLGYKSDSNSFSKVIKENIFFEEIKNKFINSDNNSIQNVYKASLSLERFELEFKNYKNEILNNIS